MSYHNDMYLKAQADLKAMRAEMEKRNLAHMEALDKIQPTPTIEEVQRAMGVTPKIDEPEEVKPIVDPPKDEDDRKDEDDKKDKSSTPDKSPGGNYKTRDMHAKR